MTGYKILKLNSKMWNYFSKLAFSPVYQAICDIDKQGIKFGDPSVPNPVQTFAAWDHLRQVYQNQEENSNDMCYDTR